MPTKQKIADALGLTRQTVSLALRDDRRVSRNTRNLVREMAVEHGYPLNQEYGKRAAIIGVMVPQLRSSVYAEFAHSIVRAASDRDHAVVIQETNDSFADENKALRLFNRLKVDGVILISSRIHVETIANLFEKDWKVASISPQINAEKMSLSIEGPKVDGRTGTRDMSQYLIDLGHRHICYFDGPNISSGSRINIAGYMDALEAFNKDNAETIQAQIIRSNTASGDYYQIGATRCEELLRMPGQRPTAIICYNDEMALGVLKCLVDNGINVPDDISVAGTHDIRESRYSTPTLTTTRLDKEEFGKRVVELIVGVSGEIPDSNEQIVPELVVRGSTGKPPLI